ncbi:MAG TPA: hypothetical protein VFJ43_11985 [Bacteroidia bacterium]|nr:hypothetical protein [Bacteroidia bacterium]
MVKSYPGFGPVFLILFFVIIGAWMFINPMLNDTASDKLNYGGLIFSGIGISLLFTLKKITLWKEGIQINYLITRKQKSFSKNEISQITIDDDERSYWERVSGSRYKNLVRIRIKFKSKDIKDLDLLPGKNTSYYQMRNFFRENYSELVNEQVQGY